MAADGTVKTPGGDRPLKPSTLVRDRPERGEEQVLRANQTDSLLQPLFKMTQHGMMRKPKNDFWSITGDFIYRHHVNRTHSHVTFSRVSQHTFQCRT